MTGIQFIIVLWTFFGSVCAGVYIGEWFVDKYKKPSTWIPGWRSTSSITDLPNYICSHSRVTI